MKIILQATHINEIVRNLSKVVSLIGEKKVGECEKHIHEDDRLSALGCRYLETINLGNREIKKGEHGKPFIEGGPEFSLSHSGQYSVIAVYNHPIGVDIEKIRQFPSKIKESFFLSKYESDEEYFKAWCIKEALLKCVGIGLAGNLLETPEQEGLLFYQGKQYFAVTIRHEGYVIAVVTEGSKPISPKLQIISF